MMLKDDVTLDGGRTIRLDRRRSRGRDARESTMLQLRHVADVLNLDAIVVADDLGETVAAVGDRDLAAVLAAYAMWAEFTEDGVDETTLDSIRVYDPTVERHHVVTETVDVERFAGGLRVIALGRSVGRGVGVTHAAAGIRRIWAAAA